MVAWPPPHSFDSCTCKYTQSLTFWVILRVFLLRQQASPLSGRVNLFPKTRQELELIKFHQLIGAVIVNNNRETLLLSFFLGEACLHSYISSHTQSVGCVRHIRGPALPLIRRKTFLDPSFLDDVGELYFSMSFSFRQLMEAKENININQQDCLLLPIRISIRK